MLLFVCCMLGTPVWLGLMVLAWFCWLSWCWVVLLQRFSLECLIVLRSSFVLMLVSFDFDVWFVNCVCL